MKFDLKQSLKSFNGQEIKGQGGEVMTLGAALSIEILQSDAKDGPSRLADFKLLQLVQGEAVDLDAKQVARLGELPGTALSIVGYGAVHTALDQPV